MKVQPTHYSHPGEDRSAANARAAAWLRRLGAVLALWFCAGAAVAQSEVTLRHGGLEVNGVLQLAEGQTLADGVVLMVHGTMAHNGMRIMSEFQRMFAERGRNSLAINLSLGVDGRRGFFECERTSAHRAQDAVDEIATWLDWLVAQGATRVTLLGFSRGGQQAAHFAAGRAHPALERVVLLAPIIAADTADAQRYAARYGHALEPVLEAARELVRTGRGDTVLRGVGFLNCDETAATAASFVSYYDLAPDEDTPALLPAIQVPTLVVVAGGDQIARDSEGRLGGLIDGQRRRMAVVPDADHFFGDLFGEDAMDEIIAFLGP